MNGYRLTLSRGARVQVHLDDTAGVLNSAPSPNQPVLLLLLGFTTGRGLFEPLALTGRDATGRNLEGTVPPNVAISLQITGRV